MLQVGDTLQDRYVIVRPLGSGGFGSVFLANDKRLGNRSVAVKYFATSHLSPNDADVAARLFQSEAHTLANLNHPNLTPVLDYFAAPDGWVLVMAYVAGDTLSALQRRLGGPFGQQQVINWAIEICQVLEYLHTQQPPLVFRDLKPSNIMRTNDGRIMLIDFGIARTFKEDQHQDTVQLGTPGYAPPEQYGGQTEPRSDLYSLGATMYVLLTNDRLTGGFSVPNVRQINPNVSAELAQLIERLTALRPSERPPSAAAVRQELELILAGKPVDAALIAKQSPAPHMQPRRVDPDAATQINPYLQQRSSRSTPDPVLTPARQQRSPRSRSANGGIAAVLVLILLVLGGIGGAVYALRDTLFGDSSVAAPDKTSPSGANTGATVTNPSTLIVSTRDGEEGSFDLEELDIATGATHKLIPDHRDNAIADRRRSDGKLVYTHGVKNADGTLVEQIFSADADGSNERQLTSGPAVNRAPRWSPDGTQIAFESSRNETPDNRRDVYIMSADGANVRQITKEAGWQGGPTWSPDGNKLAFHTKVGERFELALLDLQTNQQFTLASLADNETFWPDWSPDGTQVAFMTEKGNTTGIYLVTVQSGTISKLDNLGPGTNRWPRWSPDGQLIAFESKRDGIWQVYLYSVADKSVTRVSNSTINERWPGW